MIEDGFHNRVDIYFMNDVSEGRTTRNQRFLSNTPDLENVACRIIKDEKALFSSDIKLLAGYVMQDINTKMTYQIIRGNKVYGLDSPHHTSYRISIKSESDRIAR